MNNICDDVMSRKRRNSYGTDDTIKLVLITLIIALYYWQIAIIILIIIGIAILIKKRLSSKKNVPETPEVNVNNNNDNNNEYYEKGICFEKYVIDLFDPSYFSLYDCSRDNSKHFNRKS